jgi:hypothetical protein
MVDDINFPKGRLPLTAAGRVKRVNPKKREEEKAPFEKFLDPEDQEEKKKKKKKKKSDKVDLLGKAEKMQTQDPAESSSSNGPAEAEDDSEKKIIDVRV